MRQIHLSCIIREMKKSFFALLFLFMSLRCMDGQPVLCGTLPSQALSDAGSVLVRVTATPTGLNTCEWVHTDPSTQFRRDGVGTLFISGLPPQQTPPIVYATVFNGEFKSSGQVEDVQNPATPFDGQVVWCATTTQVLAENQTAVPLSAAQLKAWLPIVMMEVRQGAGTSQLVLNNKAWPDNTRHRWAQAHAKCNGLPGITFAKGADLIYQDDAQASRPLLQLWVVSVVPAQ